jgi:hypothetical protein
MVEKYAQQGNQSADYVGLVVFALQPSLSTRKIDIIS